jgi:hypothetical protein
MFAVPSHHHLNQSILMSFLIVFTQGAIVSAALVWFLSAVPTFHHPLPFIHPILLRSSFICTNQNSEYCKAENA